MADPKCPSCGNLFRGDPAIASQPPDLPPARSVAVTCPECGGIFTGTGAPTPIDPRVSVVWLLWIAAELAMGLTFFVSIDSPWLESLPWIASAGNDRDDYGAAYALTAMGIVALWFIVSILATAIAARRLRRVGARRSSLILIVLGSAYALLIGGVLGFIALMAYANTQIAC